MPGYSLAYLLQYTKVLINNGYKVFDEALVLPRKLVYDKFNRVFETGL